MNHIYAGRPSHDRVQFRWVTARNVVHLPTHSYFLLLTKMHDAHMLAAGACDGIYLQCRPAIRSRLKLLDAVLHWHTPCAHAVQQWHLHADGADPGRAARQHIERGSVRPSFTHAWNERIPVMGGCKRPTEHQCVRLALVRLT